MAEVSQNQTGKSAAKVRLKKRGLKLDMTPMVDLAFLLLTFFILTTTFNDPHVLKVSMPDKSDASATVNIKNILNIVLAENNQIYWWMGEEASSHLTDYSSGGIRKILLRHAAENKHLVVLVKPHDKSKYENMVDMLDELDITQTQRYAIVDLSTEDKEMIRSRY